MRRRHEAYGVSAFVPRASARAFTLLEVLIAIALVLSLLGSMFSFLFNMLAARARALDYAAKQLAAATLIERAEADLMSCLVGDDAWGPGIDGTATRLRVLTRGVAVSLAERGTQDPAVLGDLQWVEYRFDAARGRLEAGRGPAGPDSPAEFAPLGGSIYKVRFRYHDGNGWRDSFNSVSADRLPAAVEIAVWFHPWPGEEPPEPADEESDRFTFDSGGGFDDRAFAAESDLDLFDEPMPDRVRVIAIPDAAGPDEGSSEGGGLAGTKPGLQASKPSSLSPEPASAGFATGKLAHPPCVLAGVGGRQACPCHPAARIGWLMT